MNRHAPREAAPLSVAQLGIWVAQQLDVHSPIFNVAEYLDIPGPLDPDLLARAVRDVVLATDAWHQRIFPGTDGPCSHIATIDDYVLPRLDLRDRPDPLAAAEDWMRHDVECVADLERGPLFVLALLRVGDEHYQLYARAHHICSDGFSGALFCQQITEAYGALYAGSYQGFVPAGRWQDLLASENAYRQSERYQKDRAYWLQQIQHVDVAATLSGKPPGRPGPVCEAMAWLPRAEAVALRQWGQAHGASLAQIVTAAAGYYLAALTSQRDILLGVPVTARTGAHMRGIVGMVANILPLRLTFEPETTLADLTQQTTRRMRELLRHQSYRREDLRRELGLSPEAPELYGLTVNINAFAYNLAFGTTPASAHNLGSRPVNDLQLVLFDNLDQADVRVKLFGKAAHYTAEAVQAHLRRFLALLARWRQCAPDTPLSELDLLSDGERRALIDTPNQTHRPVVPAPLFALFEASVARAPDAPAISGLALDGARADWCYAELNARANQLAHALIAQGVVPGDRVSVCLPRTLELAVTLLAVLKAGAAYVPIEPDWPATRRRLLCDDTGAALLVTLASLAGGDGATRLCLDRAEFAGLPAHNPGIVVDPQALAYIIFTSGSTGTPKGVAMAHAPVANLIDWVNRRYAVGPDDRLLFVTSVAFDLSVYDLFGSFAAGASVYLASRAELDAPETLCALIEREGISFWDSAPAFLQRLTPFLPKHAGDSRLRLAFVSGDWIPLTLPGELTAAYPGIQVVGLGGATEAAIWSNWFDIEQVDPGWTSIPYGRPIQNARYYVLDARLRPVPHGVAGDLYIGGDCLALGYYRRARLTAERFLPDPHGDRPGARLYATGDRAQRLPDGTLVFLGRADRQVKIRGFRIEPGEIQAALLAHDGVDAAAVIARDGQLLAYVAGDSLSANEAVLRRALAERLPEYMLPAAIMRLAALPLTANGKLDEAALPRPTRQAAAYRAPENEAERLLCALVAEVLGIERVGLYDNFFALGGDSLSAARLLARLRAVAAPTLGLSAIFQAPSIATLAQQCGAGSDCADMPIAPAVRTRARLSFAQERLWFLDQLQGDSREYHIPDARRIRGPLDMKRLTQALNAVVARHDSLRSYFVQENSAVYQKVRPAAPWALPLVDLSALDADARQTALRQVLAREWEMPFDLSAGPLLRTSLLRLAPDDHVLLCTSHHLIADGWSTALFERELWQHYQGDTLAPLPLQYADFAEYQREQANDDEDALAYWRQQLAGAPALLTLAGDRPRPALQNYRAGWVRARLDGTAMRDMTRLMAEQPGTTPYMVLLALWAMLLGRYSGQDDVVIGSPCASRPFAELESLIGLFVNTLALRVRLAPEQSFAALLAQVRQTCLDAYRHQDVPFERLVEMLAPQRDLGHAPLFQVMLAMQNLPSPAAAPAGLTVTPLSDQIDKVRFDLELHAVPQDDALELCWIYKRELFDDARVHGWSERFLRLAAAALAAPDTPLSELDLLSDDERRALIDIPNQTRHPFVPDTLFALFEASAARAPDAPALSGLTLDGARADWGYAELNARANRLAHALIAQGVVPGDRVAVCLPRTLELAVTLLAVLKAGAAYVPIEPDWPAARRRLLCDDTGAALLVTLADLPGDDGCPRLCLDRAKFADLPSHNPGVHVDPQALAYIIFTSGSTGTPKGVAMAHAPVANLIDWVNRRHAVGPDDRLLFVTSVAFDLSVYDLFGSFAAGASVYLASRAELDAPETLCALIEREGISFWDSAPAFLQRLTPFLPKRASNSRLRLAFVSGDWIPLTLPGELSAAYPGIQVVGLGGATEAAIWSNWFDIDKVDPGWTSIPYGRPIQNARYYVLDARLRPVPHGVAGDLYIGGDCLALGYYRRARLTAERFLPDPYGDRPGARLYATGDRAQRLPDGTLVFLGRADRQVKIRGFRIELGEIQAALLAHDGVDAAAVVARDGQLLAYVAGDSLSADEAVLRRALAERLPEYMLPAAIMRLAALPLTANGKLDEAALPRPTRQAAAYRAPENEAERLLCALVAEVLGIERVGLYDNFFALGGDSIVSIQLVRRLRDAGYDLSLRKIFQLPDVAALAACLVPHAPRAAVPALAVDDGTLLATPLMQWQLARNPSIRPFSQSLLIHLPPPESNLAAFEERLARTLQALQVKHEMLRLTVTSTSEHTWRLAVTAGARPWLATRQLARNTAPDWAALAAETRQALSPATGCMLAALCLHEPGQTRLLLTVHHFAVDGVSWPILLADLAALWRQAADGIPVVEADPTFRRWSAALFSHAGLPAARAQWPTWRAQTATAAPLLSGARLQPTRDTFARAGRLRIALPADLSTALLTGLPAAYHAGVEDILLAALLMAVQIWRREREETATAFAVEVESHGREAPDDDMDLSRTVGWFTGMYPLRLDASGLSADAMLAGGEDLGRLIKRVKEAARALPALFADETPVRGRGLAYGYLRHFTPEGRQVDAPQIGFNYLGRLSVGSGAAWQADLSVDAALRLTEDDCTLLHPIDVDVAVIGAGRTASLVADWTWAPACVPDAVARSLAGHWRTALTVLARHGQRHGGHSPSDFPLLALSQPAIEHIEAAMPRIDTLLPLSPLQEGLLFHARFDDEAPDLYTVQLALTLAGPLNGERLRRAVRAMLRRHPQLNARFLRDAQQRPLQALGGEIEVPWREADFAGLPPDEAEAGLRQWRLQERRQRFSLDAPPLMRMLLARLPGGVSAWVVTHHHLLMDGWSLSLFIDGVLAHYRQEAPALPPPARYADYLAWVVRQDRAAALDAWRAYLDGVEEPCRLARQPTRADQSAWPRRWQYCLPASLGDALTQLARERRLTLNTVLQGLWAVLMARLSGRDDVVFGVTVSGRPAEVAGIEQMLGLFISTLPLRARLMPGESLSAFLSRLQDEQARLTPFQHVGLAEIQQATGRPALFDTLIVFENYPWDPANLRLSEAGLRLLAIDPDDATHYPVNLIITPQARLDLRLQYDGARLSDAEAQRIGEGFVQLLQYAADHPEALLSELDLLSDGERRALIDTPNQTRRPVVPDTLFALFEASVARQPDAPALSGLTLDGARADWCYAELNARANRLAHALIAQGVVPGDRVSVCLPRTLELAVTLLAVLKAGAAYVPIEPDWPATRRRLLCDDTGAALLVTLASLAGGDGATRLCLDRAEFAGLPAHNPGIVVDPQALAYIIFTSGSTGTPKGVAMAHAPVANLIDWVNRRYAVGPDDRLLFVTSVAFDLSVYDLFGSFAAGASVYLASRAELDAPETLCALIEREGISFWDSAPAFLQRLTPFLPKRAGDSRLRLAFVSGDWIPLTLPGELTAAYPGIQVVGLGGATEAAIWSNWFDIEQVDPGWTSIPYGRPIQNARYYVLDARLRPVPHGVAGDLYIGGDCLALGYYRRARLTAERFLPDPHGDRPGARLYATGDRAQRLPDGTLVFLGRADRQVKIRGFRIEPGEIQAALLAHDGVDAAAVIARDGQLLAYVTPRQALSTDSSARDGYVDAWRASFDATYSESAASDFNLVGWSSSYTDEPIDEKEMTQWVDGTVARLRALAPRRVLELGCGTGLLLTRLAPVCEHYLGMDFSATVLAQLHDYLTGIGAMANVELRQGMADELDFLADDSVDLVILNSVAQYFPDSDYLRKVLADAIRVTRPGGHVFVGDVRNLALLGAFHTSVRLFAAPDDTPLAVVRRDVEAACAQEAELLLDPAFFRDEVAGWPGVAHVALALKDGDYDNELSRFRYDVTVRVGAAETLAAPDETLVWDAKGDWRERMAARLAETPCASLVLDAVPDRRVAPFVHAWQAAQAGAPQTTAELARELDGADPFALFELARRLGAALDWHPLGADGRYRVRFNPRWQPASTPAARPAPHSAHANTPARQSHDATLTRALFASLRHQLPEYMLPTAIMTLPALPLTANGKLDLAALPDPVRTERPYAPPRTPREHLLCQLMAEVLAVPRIGIDDDFFSLGGHSLSAARLIGKIGAALGVRLSIRTLFEAPTVRALTPRLAQDDGAGGAFETLLPLRARGRLTPLFCIHPVGGLAWAYAGLLHGLDEERPLYGIQARGILSPEPSTADIAALAHDYVRAVRAARPQGPYLLLGWSFGGLVAHEMARQLQADGAKVGLLAMMDSYPMRPGDRLPEWDERAVLAGFAQALGIALSDEETAQLSILTFVAAARRAGHVLGCLDDAQAQRFLALLADFRRVIPSFKPGKVDGDLLFFQARKPEAISIRWAGEIAPRVWQPHVGGRIQVCPLDCSHTEMANPEPIREIGRRLEQYLRETAPQRAREQGEIRTQL